MEEIRIESKNIDCLKRVYSKVAIFLFMNNLLKHLNKCGFKSNTISQKAGKQDNALSKNVSELQDLKLSSLLRYLIAIKQEEERESVQEQLDLNELLDSRLIGTVRLVVTLEEINWGEIEETDKLIIADLHYFVNKILISERKALSLEEIKSYRKIQNILDLGDH